MVTHTSERKILDCRSSWNYQPRDDHRISSATCMQTTHLLMTACFSQPTWQMFVSLLSLCEDKPLINLGLSSNLIVDSCVLLLHEVCVWCSNASKSVSPYLTHVHWLWMQNLAANGAHWRSLLVWTWGCCFSDVNECEQNPSVCRYRCYNTWGDFECLCPPGQLRLADRKSCAG